MRQKFVAPPVLVFLTVLLVACFQAIAPTSEIAGRTLQKSAQLPSPPPVVTSLKAEEQYPPFLLALSANNGTSKLEERAWQNEGNDSSPSDIPQIIDDLDFGVPAGNGARPWQLALNSQERRLYSLNEGLASTQQGNTMSVINLETEQVTDLLPLNNMPADSTFPPTPLDLQIDPYRPRLYALGGDRYADPPDSRLTVIDTDRPAVVNSLPGVEALAVGPDRLYLANDTRLWTVDPNSVAELSGKTLAPRQYNDRLLLNTDANRLYLVRGTPWTVETFTADSLAPVGSYAASGEIVQAALDKTNRQLIIVESNGSEVALRVLDADGQPRFGPGPVPLSEGVAYANQLPLVVTESSLHVIDQKKDGSYGYQLRTFALPELAAQGSLTLPSLPYDLAYDPATGLLYANYTSPDSFILKIDPAAETTEPIYTALKLVDALADAAADRLYVLDNAGSLQIFDPATLTETDRVETGFNTTRITGGYAGQLALDPNRNRLYISGSPVRVVDTKSLTVRPYPNLQGQITPDPTGDRLYLTPTCQCRMEQCNTLILNATTMTGTTRLFPAEDPLSAPCVTATQLDPKNQLLYATIYNGVPGSNSGNFFMVFDTEDKPEKIYTASAISYGQLALDPVRQRAFTPRYRMDRSFIHQFEALGQTFTQTLELAGAQGQLAYESDRDRLYAVSGQTLQVFDGDLALQADISLPGQFKLLAFEPQERRLYLHNEQGRMLIVAATGGQLQPPPPVTDKEDERFRPHLFVAPDGTHFRITEGRLFRSRDGGQRWELLGRGLPGRPVNNLAISPIYAQDQTLLAGLWNFGRSGGLFRSTDGGDTWQPTTRGLTDLEIQEIAFSPTFGRDQTIFLTTLAKGLFRSTDGGDSWVALADTYTKDSFNQQADSLAVSPTFAAEGLLFIGYRGDLLRSTDGGQSWTDTGRPAGRVAFSPTFVNDGLVLLDGTWRSTDGGQSWQPAAAGREPTEQVVRIFFSPNFAPDQTIYLLFYRDYLSPLHLQRSVDGGQTWQSLLSGLPADFELAAATILPSDELYLTNFEGDLLTLPPAGLDWGQPVLDITHFDLQKLAIAPDGTLFVINGAAGVFKSADGGQQWGDTEFPVRAAEFPPAELAVTRGGTLFAAVSTALERSPDQGQQWIYLAGLPDDFSIVSLGVSPEFEEDGIVLAGGNYTKKQLLRSTDGGQSWEIVFEGSTVPGASDISQIAFSPRFARNGRVYAWLEEGGLLHSTDRGQSWSLATGEYSGYAAQSLAVSPDGEQVYLGAVGGHLLVSADAGQSWRNLGDNIPDARNWSSALSFGPDGTLLLGTDVGVYRSQDGGQSWTQASAGLPLDPEQGTPENVRDLAFKDGLLYAALAEGGLFVSENQGAAWRSTLTGASMPAGQPAVTPVPTATPAPTPPPGEACSALPANFADLWQKQTAQLGCPSPAAEVTLVEQSFEGGWMFWRSDQAVIYALPAEGPYARFADTWDGSQPAYSCPQVGPAQTPPTPQRGFGKVWCTEPQLRQQLGNATGPERAFETTVQEFERGLIFRADEGKIYILNSRSNEWHRAD